MATKHYVIGSGVSGIMTALRMQEAGYDVEIISNTPDPRFADLEDVRLPRGASDELATSDNFNRRVMLDASDGSSMGGGATRMATPTEGDVYFGAGNPIYPNMIEMLDRSVNEGGWLDRAPSDLTEDEQEWIARRRLYDGEDHYVQSLRQFYFSANIHGIEGWEELRKSYPRMFDNADVNDGVIRSFDHGDKLMAAIGKYANAKLLGGVWQGDEIDCEFSFLSSDKTAGVMKFKGFSFNAQQWMVNTLQHLEKNGAVLRFNTELKDIDVTLSGRVQRLRILDENGQEEVVDDPQYVSLHMGAYDRNGILEKTPAAGRVMGVAGLWMKMPRPCGMTNAMKVHVGASRDGKSPLVDLNLIPCGDHLIVGGGYIFTGGSPEQISEVSKSATYGSMIYGLKRTFKDFDPDMVEVLHGKQCSRSFTFDELPLLGRMRTTGGGHLVIAGGDNTGSTSMAPAMANLIRDYVLDINPRSTVSLDLMTRHEVLEQVSRQILSGGGGSASPDPAVAGGVNGSAVVEGVDDPDFTM